MSDAMSFPATVEEFMEQYKIVDREEVYTNGAEMVPIFRMKQWFEHEVSQNADTGKMVGDCISRQAAIEALDGELEITGRTNAEAVKGYVRLVKDRLERLPSAQPERKKGKWIDETFEPWGLVYHPYKCDQCGEHSEADSNFCPNCGADMRGEGS